MYFGSYYFLYCYVDMELLLNLDEDILQSSSSDDEEIVHIEHKKEVDIDGNGGEN